MKVAVVTPFPNLLVPKVKFHGISISNKNPDAVICLGGDGTFLAAEEKFPGVPKVLIKYHRGDKFSRSKLSRILDHLMDGKHKVVEHTKVEANVRGKGNLVGLNEINVHYRPPQAIRMSVSVNGRDVAQGELIGDGLLVATPYGSSAYFHSISGKTFARGLGLAFNNLTKRITPKLLKKNSKVKVKIIRGKGTVTADCSKKIIPIVEGDQIIIKRHPKKARILHIHGHSMKAKC